MAVTQTNLEKDNHKNPICCTEFQMYMLGVANRLNNSLTAQTTSENGNKLCWPI